MRRKKSTDTRNEARLGPGDACVVANERQLLADQQTAFHQVIVHARADDLSLALPGAFLEFGTIPQDTAGGMRKDLTYFSFVTLTTVGYGDIIAVHPLARMLVILEALVGQLFPAILLAWLVSMQIVHSKDKKQAR